MRLVHFTRPLGGPIRSNLCLLRNLLRWTHSFTGRAMVDRAKVPSMSLGGMRQAIGRRGI